MFTEQDLQNFWDEEIMPRFTEAALEARVELLDGTSVRYVNLDNAATTKPFKAVVGRVNKELDGYGSVHRGAGQHSRQTTEKYDKARNTIGSFVGATPDNYVIFTKNTTEAINQAAALLGSDGLALVSDIEHSSNLLPWLRRGRVAQFKTGARGEIDPAEIEKIIEEIASELTALLSVISVTGASNITGYQPPIYDIAELAHRHNARLLVDVCQLIPHEKVNVLPDSEPRHLDFITFSGHKMYAPFGVGVLVGPKQFFDNAVPYQLGGGNLSYITPDLKIKRPYTERDHDPGTPNAIGVLALEEAIKQLEQIGMSRIRDYEHQLVGLALEELRQIPGVIVYLGKGHSSIVPFDIQGMEPKLVAEILAREHGVGARAGSSCAYRLIDKLKGVAQEQAFKIADEIDKGITANIPGIVRASFGIYNNVNDARRFVDAVREIANNGFGYYKSRYSMNPRTGDWTPK